jgi:putative FmdB family regulatory protein
MPTYDFECEACGHTFEQWQSFHDEPLKQCPSCKKKKLRRLFGMGAAILFKGSGFYETDYRRDEKYKAAEKADQTPPAAATESKPDAKPATPAPTPSPDAPAASDTSSSTQKGKKRGK